MATLDDNLKTLRAYHPDIAARLDAYSDKDKVYILQTKDGGIGYGLRQNGRESPLTDPVSPITRIRAQLEQNSTRLQDCTKQVLIVGLYPGEELLYIFDLEKKLTKLHAQQKIFVCIDSLPCLYGFLQAFEAADVLKSPRVRLFWHENTGELVAWLKNHPEHPYAFTLLSCAANNVLDRVMPPIAALIQERTAETNRLAEENNRYYNAINDSQLAGAISVASPRAPRLITFTCNWSGVVQYSARDTCRAFEACGWQTRHLNTDSMLTAYYVAKEINEFKPDVFLFINHLRTEAAAAYPENMMFLTWIQDFNASINTKEAALNWNEFTQKRNRDLIIGYAGQLEKYGYPADRIFTTPMIVNTDLFKPRKITDEQKTRYGCNVLFASRAGQPSRQRVEEFLTEWNQGKNLACPRKALVELHDSLLAAYSEGKTFTNYAALEKFVLTVPSFAGWYSCQAPEDRDYLRQQIYWSLNDLIYRQTVIEWLADYAETHPGFTLHLYGEGWDRHPRFAKYWKGVLAHGKELSVAFQCARWCLHLNSMEGGHQRLLEIIASGGYPLTRSSLPLNPNIPLLHSALRACAEDRLRWREKLPEPEDRFVNEWLFPHVVRMLKNDNAQSDANIALSLDSILTQRLWNSPDWTIPGWNSLTFQTRAELEQMLPETPDCDMKAASKRLASVNFKNLARSVADFICSYLAKGKMAAGQQGGPAAPRADISVVAEHDGHHITDHLLPENQWQDLIQYARLLADPDTSTDELLAAFNRIRHPHRQLVVDTANRLIAAGANAPALALLDTLDPDRMTLRQLIVYAENLADGGRFDDASKMIARTYDKDKKLKDVHARIAWKHFWPKKEYGKVIEWMEKDLNHGCTRMDTDGKKKTEVRDQGSDQSKIPSCRLSPGWRLNLAHAYAANGDFSAARQQVETAYAESPVVKDGYSRIGWQLHISGQIQKAIQFFEKDLRFGRQTDPWTMRLVSLLFEKHRFQKSLTILDVMSPSRKAEVILRQAVSLVRTGQIRDSRKWLADIDPYDLSTHELCSQLAEYLMRTSQFEKALACFDICEKKPEQTKTHYLYKALTWRCLWDLDKAVKTLKAAKDIDQDTPMSIIWQARLAWFTGDNETALNILNELLLEPKLTNTEREICFSSMAIIYRTLGDVEKTLNLFNHAIKLNAIPAHWSSHFEYSATLFWTNDLQQAEQISQLAASAVKTCDNPCSVLNDRIRIYRKKTNLSESDIRRWLKISYQSASPFLSYSAIIAVWAMYASTEINMPDLTRESLKCLLKHPPALAPQHAHKIANLAALSSNLRNSETNGLIAKALFPYHEPASFDRMASISCVKGVP